MKKTLLISILLLIRLFASPQGITVPGNPSLKIYTGKTNPNGTIVHPNLGELYLQSTGSAGYLWQNTTGGSLGWTLVGATTPIDTNGYWTTTGNSGTNSTSNFIGTTDGADFLIKSGPNDSNQVLYHYKSGSYQQLYSASKFVFQDPESSIYDLTVDAVNHNVAVTASFTLFDGTQGAGKVLTSDASGNATWQTNPLKNLTLDSVSRGSNPNFILTDNSNTIAISSGAIVAAAITLPQGFAGDIITFQCPSGITNLGLSTGIGNIGTIRTSKLTAIKAGYQVTFTWASGNWY